MRKKKKNYTTIPIPELCIYPHIFMEETRYQLQDSAASAPQHATSDGVGWRHGGEYVKINLLSSGAGCKVICVCVYNKGPSKLFFEMLNISCLPPSNNQDLHPILCPLLCWATLCSNHSQTLFTAGWKCHKDEQNKHKKIGRRFHSLREQDY